MKSWKTSVAAACSAAASFVLFAQDAHYVMFPSWAMGIAVFAQVGGLAAFGIAAKDSNVTGGSIGQPSTQGALMAANQAPSAANPPQGPPAIAIVEVKQQ